MEVFLIDDLRKYSHDEKTEYLSSMFCPDIEDLKMRENSPLNFGIYLQMRMEQGSHNVDVDVCLRTGIDYNLNSKIKNMINSEDMQNCLNKLVSYSREMVIAKKMIQNRNEEQGETGDSKIFNKRKAQGEKETVTFMDLFQGLDALHDEGETTTPQSTLESDEKSQGNFLDDTSELSDFEGSEHDTADMEALMYDGE
jgi:hypothetical protein